jgi:hypothetical protein
MTAYSCRNNNLKYNIRYFPNPIWNPKADMDGNGKINLVDISTMARKFGKSL